MNVAIEWKLYIGLNDGRTGKPIKAERVQATFKGLVDGLTEDFGGCTLTAATGAWGNVREESVVVTVISERPLAEAYPLIRDAAVYAKNHLRQETVYLSKRVIEIEAV